jgi:DNA-binding NarL/FixJ family response regulator
MSIRVVLADDSEVLRRTLSRFLSADSGIELVGVAEDVPEALRVLRETGARVLLFDLHMAVRRQDHCDELKAAAAQAVLVAISMDAGNEGQALAERCGATALIDKMKLHDELVPAITRAASSEPSPTT